MQLSNNTIRFTRQSSKLYVMIFKIVLHKEQNLTDDENAYSLISIKCQRHVNARDN
jgi:hypothetical protein